jgi:hypothetical protein
MDDEARKPLGFLLDGLDARDRGCARPPPQKRMSDSPDSGSPSKTASTAASPRLRTQPVTARASATRATAPGTPRPERAHAL